jgi:hypothetical protein
MSDSSNEFQWMRNALDVLYDAMSEERARQLLYNEPERTAALETLRTTLSGNNPPQAIPTGDLSDNLFQALLAIRIKFSPEEGRQKVELNIAMRQRPR